MGGEGEGGHFFVLRVKEASEECKGIRKLRSSRLFPFFVLSKKYQKGCQIQPLASIVTLEEGSFNWRNMMMAWVTYQSTHCQRDGIGNSSAFAQKPDFDRYGPGSRTLSDPLPSPLRCSRDMPLPHGACLRPCVRPRFVSNSKYSELTLAAKRVQRVGPR